jgi:nucleoside 2-deoxyribosyltransferase
MRPDTAKIYCAGPLFTPKEQEEMVQLATALEGDGYTTFLPHRDGLELTKCVGSLVTTGIPIARANHLMSNAIFALDVYQVLHRCDALVANLNGRVPDEGTVSEASMAWSRGKVVVGYKTDSRTVFGGQDNPLVAGLFDFELCSTVDRVLEILRDRLEHGTSNVSVGQREAEISTLVSLGSDIWTAMVRGTDFQEVVKIIADFGACNSLKELPV